MNKNKKLAIALATGLALSGTGDSGTKYSGEIDLRTEPSFSTGSITEQGDNEVNFLSEGKRNTQRVETRLTRGDSKLQGGLFNEYEHSGAKLSDTICNNSDRKDERPIGNTTVKTNNTALGLLGGFTKGNHTVNAILGANWFKRNVDQKYDILDISKADSSTGLRVAIEYLNQLVGLRYDFKNGSGSSDVTVGIPGFGPVTNSNDLETKTHTYRFRGMLPYSKRFCKGVGIEGTLSFVTERLPQTYLEDKMHYTEVGVNLRYQPKNWIEVYGGITNVSTGNASNRSDLNQSATGMGVRIYPGLPRKNLQRRHQ